MNLKETIAELERLRDLFAKKADQHRAEALVERMSSVVTAGRMAEQRAKTCDDGKVVLESAIRHLTAKSKRLAFVPPTLLEIEARMVEIGLPKSEASKFFAHYQSNGWKVGGNGMRDWKAATDTWKARFFEKNPTAAPKADPSDSDPTGWRQFLTKEQVPYKAFKYAPDFLKSKFKSRA